MKVHILILNYNGAGLLEKYLPSFLAATDRSGHTCRLSVIDNASTDASRGVVDRFKGRAAWIPLRENRVLCAYNDVARDLDDDVVIFMNNDIEVDPGFVDPLVRPFLSEKEVFFVTPCCLSKDRKTYEGNKTRGAIRYGIYWSTALYPGYEKDTDRPGLTLQGGFGAFDRKKFLELGGYDDLYLPGRLEDADICFRAYKKGWYCLYEPASVVYHQGGVSFHKAFGVRKTMVINWRNTFLFMWKNLSDPSIWMQFYFWLPIRLLYSLIFLKPELFLGFIQAFPRLGSALNKRGDLRRAGLLRAVPDNSIFNRT